MSSVSMRARFVVIWTKWCTARHRQGDAERDAEADDLYQAQRYERSANRIDTRAGHYKHKYQL